MSTGIIQTPKRGRVFYCTNVNMTHSFDKLQELATQLYRLPLKVGDILICDNADGTKRKVFQKGERGSLIFYARIEDKGDKFQKLLDKEKGEVKHLRGPVI